MKSVHEILRSLQYSKARINRLIKHDTCLGHLNHDQLVVDDGEATECRFGDEFLHFLWIADKMNGSSVANILKRFACNAQNSSNIYLYIRKELTD